jgi:hypothetical protein
MSTEQLGELKLNKHEARGTCLTCRRGFFSFYAVWCMHPTNPSGYNLHSPFDSCPCWEVSGEFKLLDRILTVQRNPKYVDQYVVKQQGNKVIINGRNKILNATESQPGGSNPPESNPLPASSKPTRQTKERMANEC